MSKMNNKLLYRVWQYLDKMQYEALDASRSPFCIEQADECRWFAEYYEGGKDVISDLISGVKG